MGRTLAILCALLALPSPAPAKGVSYGPGRAACEKALARGDLDALRVTWTIWQTREISQTVEVKRGKVTRYGGNLRNARSERALSDEEKRTLLEALRTARVDRLVVVDRDVKNDQDRVLNVDVLSGDDAPVPVGAFVRTGRTWRTGPTTALADLLEKWLAPGT